MVREESEKVKEEIRERVMNSPEKSKREGESAKRSETASARCEIQGQSPGD